MKGICAEKSCIKLNRTKEGMPLKHTILLLNKSLVQPGLETVVLGKTLGVLLVDGRSVEGYKVFGVQGVW